MSNPTFYLLHGDDGVSRDEVVKSLRAGMDEEPNGELNTDEFDGEQSSVAEVINAVSSFPFLSSKRLVIVKGLVGWITRKGAGQTGKKELDLLLESLPTLPESARLVLVERVTLPANNPVVKLAQSHENGYVKAFETPKDATRWIIQRAQQEYNITIDGQAARALAEVTREDIRRADNELVKLVSFVDEARPITVADVEALTPYVADENVFAMVDAVVAGNGHNALHRLHRLLHQNPRDPGFGLFAMLTTHFRRLLLTREHLASGGSAKGSDIAEAIGIRSGWQAEKLAKQSRAFSVAELEGLYRHLQDYDHQIKTGRMSIGLALELFVTILSRKG